MISAFVWASVTWLEFLSVVRGAVEFCVGCSAGLHALRLSGALLEDVEDELAEYGVPLS